MVLFFLITYLAEQTLVYLSVESSEVEVPCERISGNSTSLLGIMAPLPHTCPNPNAKDRPSSSSPSQWNFSRQEIEENSPSRKDGIDLKKETHLRRSYTAFVQDLGMRVNVPQLTIATATVFCHRFFHRQSHANNDRRIIGTACLFLAAKVDDNPRPRSLRDVTIISYQRRNKKDPSAYHRIKNSRALYEQQRKSVLDGEWLVLVTLGFDLNILHPYNPLLAALKKLEVSDNGRLAQVAWNFLNDSLRTSLSLQFSANQIAAGSVFLGTKFLGVALPHLWWQDLDTTPQQLEEMSNQWLELYEENNNIPVAVVGDHGSSIASNNITN